MPLCTGRVLERATTLGQAALYSSSGGCCCLRDARCARIDTPTTAALHHGRDAECVKVFVPHLGDADRVATIQVMHKERIGLASEPPCRHVGLGESEQRKRR
jgi:hypothetical protein